MFVARRAEFEFNFFNTNLSSLIYFLAELEQEVHIL